MVIRVWSCKRPGTHLPGARRQLHVLGRLLLVRPHAVQLRRQGLPREAGAVQRVRCLRPPQQQAVCRRRTLRQRLAALRRLHRRRACRRRIRGSHRQDVVLNLQARTLLRDVVRVLGGQRTFTAAEMGLPGVERRGHTRARPRHPPRDSRSSWMAWAAVVTPSGVVDQASLRRCAAVALTQLSTHSGGIAHLHVLDLCICACSKQYGVQPLQTPQCDLGCEPVMGL